MLCIYQTRVTDLGKMVTNFSVEKMIILFKDNAPEDLADYCVLHSKNQVFDVIQEQDVLVIGDAEYKILYVGEEVQSNLQNLGHITLRFVGRTKGLGGSLYLEDKAVPTIHRGDRIAIYRK